MPPPVRPNNRKENRHARQSLSTIHLVWQAHLDPVWLWRRAEGLSEARATFRSALERMREYPEFIHTASAAAMYEWVERVEPCLFAEIRQAVREGRWVPVGGWETQSDVNFPAGESFARNALYAQRWFRRKFGRVCRVGYCVDSFGHAASLPQLLRLGGMDAYVFARPGPHEQADLPEGSFVWEGSDGTRVTAFHIYGSYQCGSLAALRKAVARVADAGPPMAMCFAGVGDHGGGPTREMLDGVPLVRNEFPSLRIVHSSPDRFFDALKMSGQRLPVFRGELWPHAVGCYSAWAAFKRLHRKTEETLMRADKLSVAACLAAGASLPTVRAKEAWKMLLFNQFHDIVAGTCEREASAEAAEHLGAACFAARELETEAVQKIGAATDTRGAGAVLLVFNPHPTPCRALIETDDLQASFQTDRSLSLTDAAGRALPFQAVTGSASAGRIRAVFETTLPALGWRCVRFSEARPGRRAARPKTARAARLTASPAVLANAFLRVQLNPDGTVRLFDRQRGWNVSLAAGRPVLLADRHDTWAHGATRFDREVGRVRFLGADLIEAGPLRARWRVRFRIGASSLILDWLLGRTDRTLEIRGVADWRERDRILKLAFPVRLPSVQSCTAEIPYGVLTRAADGTERPIQQWADVSDRRRGLAVANDGLYGADVRGNEIRLTLLRGACFAQHEPWKNRAGDRRQDRGEHDFRLRLIPHGPAARSEIAREARLLNSPPVLSWEGAHAGALPPDSDSVLLVRGSVWCDGLKGAEEGQALILRAHETAGRRSSATFRIPALGRAWQATFRAGEIKTFRVPLARKSPIRETNFLEDETGR